MLTTSDTLSLAFGLAATVLAVLAIFVTLYLRHARSVPSASQDIEMRPIIPELNTGSGNVSEHDVALKALEMVLGLFRRTA
ncbi:hypothetical protein IFR04_005698 [Cadophora malorum]|uniref:Uncharacterized protein n=1 Tax=Cadophora malorum TaxID=108018 RepID=A0A8H7TLY3_9HELO|nr:hypothetical protein IFR04_005698 [Cadophora malorum]